MMMTMDGDRNLFITHSYLQSFLRWRVILRYTPVHSETQTLIEEIYYGVHRYLKTFFDKYKLYPANNRKSILGFALFIEVVEYLRHLDLMEASAPETMIDILYSRLEFSLVHVLDPRRKTHQMKVEDQAMLTLLNTVKCLLPCILPQYRYPSDAHSIEFCRHRYPEYLQKSEGKKLGPPVQHHPQCCLNWVVSIVPKALFCIFDVDPADFSDMLDEKRHALNFKIFNLNRLQDDGDVELNSAYMVWLAIYAITRELLATALG